MEYTTNNLEETYRLAEGFVRDLGTKNLSRGKGATIVGLYGDLGAGKTSFTQGVAKAFGIKDYVTSPTFVLEKIYKLGKGFAYEHLIHIDCYRLNGAKEMSALGWDELIREPKNIILIEWPERIEDILPKEMIKIYFETGEKENVREVRIVC